MENNSSFLRKIVVVLLILLFFVLQCSVFNSLAMGGIIPNLMIILTSSFGFMRGEKEGLLIGFSCGLLCDIFFGSFLGFYAMVMMYIGFVNGKFSRIFYPEDIKLPLALIIVSDISYGLICYILMFLLRGRFHFPYYFTSVILPEALYTIVVTIILYPLILKINQKLEEKEKGAHRNLFREIRDHIINIVTSRLTVLMILFAFLPVFCFTAVSTCRS